MTNVATAMIELLAEAGVRHVFGVPSGPWAPYISASGAEELASQIRYSAGVHLLFDRRWTGGRHANSEPFIASLKLRPASSAAGTVCPRWIVVPSSLMTKPCHDSPVTFTLISDTPPIEKRSAAACASIPAPASYAWP